MGREVFPPYRNADNDEPVVRYQPTSYAEHSVVRALVTDPTFAERARRFRPEMHISSACADLYYSVWRAKRNIGAQPTGLTVTEAVAATLAELAEWDQQP